MIQRRKGKSHVFLYMVPLQEDSYHVFLDAKVNDKKIRLLLDTGASRTVLDKNYIMALDGDLNIEMNPEMATGLGSSQVENYMCELDSLELGDLRIENWQIGLLDLSHVNQSYANVGINGIEGVLGSDILIYYNAVINYKKKSLVLDIKKEK